MGHFTPCKGKDHCTEDGRRCEGCGRTHGEVHRTRFLLDSAVSLALEHDYDNVEDYAAYLAEKIVKFVHSRRAAGAGA